MGGSITLFCIAPYQVTVLTAVRGSILYNLHSMLQHVPVSFFSPLLVSFVVMLIIKCNLLQTNVLYHEGYDSSNDHQYSHGPCNTQYVRIFIVLHVCACLFISGKGMDVGGRCGGNRTVWLFSWGIITESWVLKVM